MHDSGPIMHHVNKSLSVILFNYHRSNKLFVAIINLTVEYFTDVTGMSPLVNRGTDLRRTMAGGRAVRKTPRHNI